MPDSMLAEDVVTNERHSDEDNAIWDILSRKAYAIQRGRFSLAFEHNVRSLGMIGGPVPSLDGLNRRIHQATGWRLDPIVAYGDDERVYARFAERKFPAIGKIRPRSQIDRAMAPDLFHDYWGHVWMLVDPCLTAIYEAFGSQSLSVAQTPYFVFLKHLYVNTMEFGLAAAGGTIEGFGAALASAPEELLNALEGEEPLRVRFDPTVETDVLRIMRTDFHFSKLQETYFIITDWLAFARLLASDLSPYYEKIADLAGILPGEHCPSDVLVSS